MADGRGQRGWRTRGLLAVLVPLAIMVIMFASAFDILPVEGPAFIAVLALGTVAVVVMTRQLKLAGHYDPPPSADPEVGKLWTRGEEVARMGAGILLGGSIGLLVALGGFESYTDVLLISIVPYVLWLAAAMLKMGARQRAGKGPRDDGPPTGEEASS